MDRDMNSPEYRALVFAAALCGVIRRYAHRMHGEPILPAYVPPGIEREALEAHGPLAIEAALAAVADVRALLATVDEVP
jgi:hypothetical protein